MHLMSPANWDTAAFRRLKTIASFEGAVAFSRQPRQSRAAEHVLAQSRSVGSTFTTSGRESRSPTGIAQDVKQSNG